MRAREINPNYFKWDCADCLMHSYFSKTPTQHIVYLRSYHSFRANAFGEKNKIAGLQPSNFSKLGRCLKGIKGVGVPDV